MNEITTIKPHVLKDSMGILAYSLSESDNVVSAAIEDADQGGLMLLKIDSQNGGKFYIEYGDGVFGKATRVININPGYGKILCIETGAHMKTTGENKGKILFYGDGCRLAAFLVP